MTSFKTQSEASSSRIMLRWTTTTIVNTYNNQFLTDQNWKSNKSGEFGEKQNHKAERGS